MASLIPFQTATRFLRTRTVSWRSSKLASSTFLSCPSLQATPLATRFFASDDKPPPSGADYHAFFQEQLAELNRERVSLFGTADDHDEDDPFSSTMNQTHQMNMNTAAKPPSHTLTPPPDMEEEPVQEDNTTYEKDMEDLHAEREALFKFSAEEKQAWGTMASKPDAATSTLSPQLMQEIARARQAHFDAQDQPPIISEVSSSVPQPPPPTPPPPSTQTFIQPEPMVLTPDSHHPSFSHVSQDGASVHMVDVGSKQVSTRTATAQTKVLLPASVLEAFAADDHASSHQQQSNSNNNNTMTELVGPKGPIFATAKIAGIMAAKKTSDLIPLCHPLPLDQVKVDISMNPTTGEVLIECTCRVTHKTGVEMEALTGAAVTALTIYDMVKAVSHHVQITDTKLITKTGGKRTVQNAEYV